MLRYSENRALRRRVEYSTGSNSPRSSAAERRNRPIWPGCRTTACPRWSAAGRPHPGCPAEHVHAVAGGGGGGVRRAALGGSEEEKDRGRRQVCLKGIPPSGKRKQAEGISPLRSAAPHRIRICCISPVRCGGGAPRRPRSGGPEGGEGRTQDCRAMGKARTLKRGSLRPPEGRGAGAVQNRVPCGTRGRHLVFQEFGLRPKNMAIRIPGAWSRAQPA